MMIGRISEREKLIRAYKSEYSQFVTVYGRRRVGKTFFVRETFGYKFAFEHAGLANSPMKKQLKAWQYSLKGFGRKDILLIVCGSATSWIINKLIKNHGGLRGRVTTKISIKPFSLKECEEYAKAYKLGMSRRQILESYMIMGGVPFYWTFLDRSKSLAQNIDNIFFNPEGDLHNEYDDLYASLFRNPESYIKIIEALGTKRIGLSRDEIISIASIPDNGNVSTMLEDLEYCGFIRRYNHIGFAKKNAIYQLMDPFTLFYFKFMRSNERNDEHFWSHSQGSPTYYNWCGLAFEMVCMQHIAQIKASLGIEGIISNVCSWKSGSKESDTKGAQIDLVIERNDNAIDLCEIKYTKEKFSVTSEYNDVIQNKRARFIEEYQTHQAVHLVLISANEVIHNSYYDEFQNVIYADSLFS